MVEHANAWLLANKRLDCRNDRLTIIIDGLLTYAVAFVVTLATERRQRLGDIAAHTLVVRKAMPGPVSHHVAR